MEGKNFSCGILLVVWRVGAMYSELPEIRNMVHIHATQKLLNTSRLTAPLHITEAGAGQMFHSWYADVQATGFAGKMLVAYFHEPSLLTIVCKGKTIKGTWDEFTQRLPALLQRHKFDPAFIQREIALTDEYVVSKTNSRSMLAYMREMKLQLEFMCSKFNRYEDIDLDPMEDTMMGWPYKDPAKRSGYTTPVAYWKEKGVLL